MKYFSLLITTLFMLWHNPALALGLGNPTSPSALGNNLYVEIPIIGIGDMTDDDLKISIASKDTYKKMNVDLEASHQTLKFAIRHDAEKVTLVITSPKAINEPYIHFLVEIVSPQGTVLKDVALLLDAPQQK